MGGKPDLVDGRNQKRGLERFDLQEMRHVILNTLLLGCRDTVIVLRCELGDSWEAKNKRSWS